MEQVRTKSVEPQSRFALPEINWDELNEPGAYVERGTGDLYRVPKEAIIPGGSPIIHKESTGSSRLVQVSKNPFVTTLEARLRCAQHNIEPNQPSVPRTVHLAHSTGTNRRDNFIGAQFHTWVQGHKWPDYNPRPFGEESSIRTTPIDAIPR